VLGGPGVGRPGASSPGNPGGGRPTRWLQAAAWVVLAVGTTSSVTGGVAFRAEVQHESQSALNAEASDVAASIASSVARMNDLTATMQNYLAAHPDTTNRQWAKWYRSLNIPSRYPSVRTFGYVQVVPQQRLPAFVAGMRTDPRPGVDPSGPFVIVPPGKRPQYCLIRLGSLAGSLAALPAGMDICALVPGQFMEPPRDTGRLVVAPVAIDDKPMAEILAPVYRDGVVPPTPAGRRQNLLGVIGGIFDVQDMLNSALKAHPSLSVRLFRKDLDQGGLESRLPPGQEWMGKVVIGMGDQDRADVGHAGPPERASALHHDAAFTADGHWLVRVSGPPRTGTWSATQQGLGVTGVGLLVTGLLFALVSVLSRGRARALELVAERTAELASSEERFRSLAASTPVGILQIDEAGAFQYGNERLCLILGRSPAELAGTAWVQAFHPEDRDEVWQAVLDSADGVCEGIEARIALPGATYEPGHTSGEEVRWVRFSAANLGDGTRGRGRVSSVEDVTAEILSKDQLTREARHDALTGLPNRLHFLERLTSALDTMREGGAPVAVLFIDLDRFKQVNDAHGHAAGDEVLVAVARRLSASLRPGDVLARLGGDEFAVLLPDIGEMATATAMIDQLQAAVETPITITAGEVSVGASVGLVLVDDPNGSPGAILQDADMAMYRAKGGSSRYEVYTSALRENLLARMETEQSLSGAMDREEFTLAYQPVIDLATGTCAGAEALIRWNHPTRGLLLPRDFLPLAESTGRIVPIGEWVLRTAVHTATSWAPLRDGAGPRISVNFSAQQLAAPTLVADVEALLAATGIDPGRVYVEVLETHLLDDANIAVLSSLKSLGVKVAIDDFGAGSSALLHLKRLPADAVKIDSRIVADLVEQPADRIIVGKIVEMAHDLGMTVVAEGVEHDHQADLLRAAGCEHAQGFLWSPAVPLADFQPHLNGGPVPRQSIVQPWPTPPPRPSRTSRG
jgi:diguanylate cyclase (GGDEF)-like protein/PAS domain S-box-containing protein